MKAVDIADYMVYLAGDMFGDLTNMKINKLLYYLQGQSFLVRGRTAFDDDIEAWDHGPVVNSVYAKYVLNGNRPIVAGNVPLSGDISEEDRDFIRMVLRKYGAYTAGELREMTHRRDTPWRRNYKKGQSHTVIPIKDIQAYFEENEEAVKPFEPQYGPDDYIGQRDGDGILVLPKEWDDEAV